MARFADTRSGQLHQSVAFQKRVYVDDGYGNEQGDFETVFETKAGFTMQNGSESVIAARLTGVQPMRVRVRSTANTRAVKPDWRMIEMRTERMFAIRAVMQNYDDRKWIDILVTEGVAA